MERIVLPESVDTVGFSFPQPARSGQNVLTLKNVRQSYDGKRWVYDGLDFTVERGQRVALIGPERLRQIHFAETARRPNSLSRRRT